MKLRGLLVMLIAILATSSLLLACSAPAPTTAPTTAPTAEPTMKQQNWNYLMYMGTVSTFEDVEMQVTFDRIEARTNGLLNMTVMPAGSLPIKPADKLRAVSQGELEMCLAHSGLHSGDFPFMQITALPAMSRSPVEMAAIAADTFSILQQEMHKNNIHLLIYRTPPAYGLFTNKPIPSLRDLGGMKIRAYSRDNAMYVEAHGATAVTIDWSEAYTALQQGVAEGLATGISSVNSAKMYEVAPYGYDLGYAPVTLWPAVNLDLWNSLPQSVKDIVNEEMHAHELKLWAHYPFDKSDAVAAMKATGRLESWSGLEDIPEGYFEQIYDRCTKTLLNEALEKAGPVGLDILAVIENAVGRKFAR